jgi:hypothetical protein
MVVYVPQNYFLSRLLDFVDNDCAAVSRLVWYFTDRAPARIPAVMKPIDAANIISMTTIAADHMLISANDGWSFHPFWLG